jgi:hypothetical protein
VTTSLAAFPPDGYTARWQSWDHEHLETLTLRWENEGWTATGELGREAATYVVRLSATWQVRQVLLFRDLDEPDLWLGADGTGRWGEVNGAHRPDLAGCTDVAFAVTPFTYSMAIRRMQLDIGERRDVTAAWIDVDTLGIVAVTTPFTRVGRRRFEAGQHRFDVDDYGLVHDVPEQFRRT